ncbi:MAG: acyl-CoA thioesterase [Acidobacteria bacterium]|nr:acyl-CoA thioesterase [Acidobacteriota bacterium]
MEKADIKRSDFKCWIEVDIRWGDMDALGHVNNTRYFTFCESARIRYFESLELNLIPNLSEGPTLAHANLNFRKQVHYPARLDVGVRVSSLKTRSFQMDYGLFLAGTETLVAEGFSIIVWADYKQGKSADMPKVVRDAIKKLDTIETVETP